MGTAREPAAEPGQRNGGLLLTGAAAIVLAPYATVTMPYGRALVVQAGLMLGIVLVVLAAGLVRGGRPRRVLQAPSEVVLGVALWAGVTLLASAVGLARGNALRDVAGQALALGLLPLAVAAARGAGIAEPGRRVALGLFGGAVVATLIQFVHWLLTLDSPGFNPRLFMANQVAPLGPAFLALLAGVAVTVGLRGWRGRAAAAGLASIVAYIVLSGTRGLWLVAPIGLIVLVTVARAWTARLAAVLAGVALALALAGFAASAAVRAWLDVPRANLVPDPVVEAHAWLYPAGSTVLPAGPAATGELGYRWRRQPNTRQAQITSRFGVSGGRLMRLRARLAVDSSEPSGVVLRLLDHAGRPCVAYPLFAAARDGEQVVERIVPSPVGTAWASITVVVNGDGDGQVGLGSLELHDLGPAILRPLYLQWQAIGGRAWSLASSPSELAASQRSVSLRVEESRRLAGLIASADWTARLLGHGLGARYRFEAGGLDPLGNRVVDPNPNYIHNFYMFLLFKTGVVGTLAMLAALALWLRAALVGARRATAAWPRLWSAAVAGALVAYCAWGVASPEFINFRVAPLFGLMLAGLESVPTDRPDAGRGPLASPSATG